MLHVFTKYRAGPLLGAGARQWAPGESDTGRFQLCEFQCLSPLSQSQCSFSKCFLTCCDGSHAVAGTGVKKVPAASLASWLPSASSARVVLERAYAGWRFSLAREKFWRCGVQQCEHAVSFRVEDGPYFLA